MVKNNLGFTKEEQKIPKVKGFQEVVFSVYDLERSVDFYQDTMGWKLKQSGKANRDLLQFWSLSETVEMEERVLMNPGDKEGFLRLVKFHNVAQKQIRSSGKAWDTGGIFDINLRAKDLAASFKAFQEAGWNGYSDPLRYQFGQFDVGEVLMLGPDGITIAMMQRYAPTLEGFPNLKKLSHVFNSTHITKNIELARHFFVEQLGFKIYMEVEGLDRKAGRNVLGIPPNMNEELVLPVFIVHPDGTNLGSVEFIQLKGLDGNDYSHLAKPPNLGILMLRFPVSNAEAYAKLLEERGLELEKPIEVLSITPYGKVKIFAVRSPDGVWLEFMEKIS